MRIHKQEQIFFWGRNDRMPIILVALSPVALTPGPFVRGHSILNQLCLPQLCLHLFTGSWLDTIRCRARFLGGGVCGRERRLSAESSTQAQHAVCLHDWEGALAFELSHRKRSTATSRTRRRWRGDSICGIFQLKLTHTLFAWTWNFLNACVYSCTWSAMEVLEEQPLKWSSQKSYMFHVSTELSIRPLP